MKKIIVFFLVFTNCAITLSSSESDNSTTTTSLELTKCEILELEYTNLSNKLFNTSFELNIIIDDISANNTECAVSGDQEISLEQVDSAKNDLEEFKKKYNN